MSETTPGATPALNQDNKASSENLGKLFEALSKAQGSMQPAELDCVNQFFKRPDGSMHRYASLASVMTAIKKPFQENGLSIMQQVFSKKNHYYCRTLLGHSSGEWISTTFQLILNKNDMQGLGSAITYAKRYAVAAMAGVVDSDDDDGNGATGKYDDKTKPSARDQSKGPTQAQKPASGGPKNYAPDAYNELDAALQNRPMTPDDEKSLAAEARHHDMLQYLYELVEMKHLKPAEVSKIIELAVGRKAKSNELTLAEVETVVSELKNL